MTTEEKNETKALRETIDEQGRGIMDAAHRLARSEKECSALREHLSLSVTNLAHADEKITELQAFIKAQGERLEKCEKVAKTLAGLHHEFKALSVSMISHRLSQQTKEDMANDFDTRVDRALLEYTQLANEKKGT